MGGQLSEVKLEWKAKNFLEQELRLVKCQVTYSRLVNGSLTSTYEISLTQSQSSYIAMLILLHQDV